MATHGEKRWPPAGRFNGRLWGAFHGHRQEAQSHALINEAEVASQRAPALARPRDSKRQQTARAPRSECRSRAGEGSSTEQVRADGAALAHPRVLGSGLMLRAHCRRLAHARPDGSNCAQEGPPSQYSSHDGTSCPESSGETPLGLRAPRRGNEAAFQIPAQRTRPIRLWGLAPIALRWRTLS